MRILVLTHEYPPVGGGGGRVAMDLCAGLAERGHELHVLTMHLHGLPRAEEHGRVKVTRLSVLRREAARARLLDMGLYVLRGFFRGLDIIRKWRPDVIHVHFALPAGSLAWALSRVTGVPYVLTAHLGDVPGGVPEKTDHWFRFFFPFTPAIWKNASRVAAVSEFTRGLALKHYPVEIRSHNPPRIIFAGRFMDQKNPLFIVKVLAGLPDLRWECRMLGDGPLKVDVEKAIRESGLEGRFHLPGWVTPQEVIAGFGESDILFMPSLSEGLPVVGVQALAMGLAVVASRAGGFVDLVEQGRNGYLYERDDLDGMQAGLRSLLADEGLLLKFRLESRRLAGRFALSEVVSRYESVLEGAGSGS
jgi:L-malate glycosyltransferase